MAYIRDIPLGTDQLAASQGQLLGNFQEIDTFVRANHTDFNGADQGKHNLLQMFINNAFTNLIPNVNGHEIILGNQANAITLRNELTLKRNGSVISIVTSKRSDHGLLTDINKQVRLFSGLLLKFDVVELRRNQGGEITVNFTTGNGYVPFVTIYNVFISNFALNGQVDINVRLMSFNATSVTVYVTERTSTSIDVQLAGFSILAIGV